MQHHAVHCCRHHARTRCGLRGTLGTQVCGTEGDEALPPCSHHLGKLGTASGIEVELEAGQCLPWVGEKECGHLFKRPVLGVGALLTRLNADPGLGHQFFIFGLAYGPVLSAADTFLTQMPVLGEFLPDSAGVDGARLFANIIVGLGALVATVPVVQVITRLGKDEKTGRTTPLLATSVSRLRWYGASALLSLSAAIVMVVAFCLGFGTSAAAAVGELRLFGKIVWAGLGYLPAIAVVIGVASALVGWWPRRIGLSWLVLIHAVIVFYFAALLDWPSWATSVSPFHHIAARPALDGDISALAVLSLAAAALMIAGAMGYRRRTIS